jgi:uncharacterized protein
MTGFYRDGLCRTDALDEGRHVVCAQMTEEFLVFSKAAGNDLSTPRPEYDFPGLKAGDFWCLCALRWKQAFDAGKSAQSKTRGHLRSSLSLHRNSRFNCTRLPNNR